MLDDKEKNQNWRNICELYHLKPLQSWQVVPFSLI
jgi:hypothetical protein